MPSSSALSAAGLNICELRQLIKLDIGASSELQDKIDQIRNEVRNGKLLPDQQVQTMESSNKDMTKDLIQRIEKIEGQGPSTPTDREMLQALHARLAVCDQQTMRLAQLRDLDKEVQQKQRRNSMYKIALPLGGTPRLPSKATGLYTPEGSPVDFTPVPPPPPYTAAQQSIPLPAQPFSGRSSEVRRASRIDNFIHPMPCVGAEPMPPTPPNGMSSFSASGRQPVAPMESRSSRQSSYAESKPLPPTPPSAMGGSPRSSRIYCDDVDRFAPSMTTAERKPAASSPLVEMTYSARTSTERLDLSSGLASSPTRRNLPPWSSLEDSRPPPRTSKSFVDRMEALQASPSPSIRSSSLSPILPPEIRLPRGSMNPTVESVSSNFEPDEEPVNPRPGTVSSEHARPSPPAVVNNIFAPPPKMSVSNTPVEAPIPRSASGPSILQPWPISTEPLSTSTTSLPPSRSRYSPPSPKMNTYRPSSPVPGPSAAVPSVPLFPSKSPPLAAKITAFGSMNPHIQSQQRRDPVRRDSGKSTAEYHSYSYADYYSDSDDGLELAPPGPAPPGNRMSASWPLLYRILEVSPYTDLGAVQANAKNALARLSLKHEPVRFPNDPDAATRWAAIRKAYEILTDPEKKRFYDLHGREPEELEGFEIECLRVREGR